MSDILDMADDLVNKVNDLVAKVEYLEAENRRLRNAINSGIGEQCGFFCALPECAKALSAKQGHIPF